MTESQYELLVAIATMLTKDNSKSQLPEALAVRFWLEIVEKETNGDASAR